MHQNFLDIALKTRKTISGLRTDLTGGRGVTHETFKSALKVHIEVKHVGSKTLMAQLKK